MGKLIEGAVAVVEIDGVTYAAEVLVGSAELAPVRGRGPGLAKARQRAPLAEVA